MSCLHPLGSLVPVGAIWRGNMLRVITVRCESCGEIDEFRLAERVAAVKLSGLRVTIHPIDLRRIPEIPAEALELPPLDAGGPRAESNPNLLPAG